MTEINDNDSNVGKSEIDFTELDGQLELIIGHLEKKDKKKAVSYYLKESTIERIKICAQKFNMKDSLFLEEAINKLIDVIENRNQQVPSEQAVPERPEATEAIQLSDEKSVSGFSEKQIVTPWGRLTEVKRATVANQPTISKQVSVNSIQADVNAKSGADTSADVNVRQDVEETEPAVSVVANDSEQLEQLEVTLIDYIINNYRQDYRMLYRRFEQIVQSELSIEPHILIELVRKLDRQGELTYYAKQNLIDINKKLFEARSPNLKGKLKYYEDDDFIE